MVVVLFVLIVGFYILVKPSNKVDVAPTKSAITQPVAPVKK